MEKTLDMTQGSIAKGLLQFAIPVFLSAVLNQLYYLVDTLVISKCLGDSALAAVTNDINLLYFITSFIFGLGMGMSVVISQAFGAKKYEWMRQGEYTGIAGALILAIVFLIVGRPLSRPLLVMLHTPADVMDLSVEYMSVVLCGCGGMILNSICGSISQAVGDSKTPLYFLILSTVINIVLDILFMAVFGWGIWSAAAATVFSMWTTGVLMTIHLCRRKDESGIDFRKIRIYPQSFKEILRMGIPGAVESSASSLANAIVQGFLNTFGPAAMAAAGAFMTIEGFCFLPITAFSSAIGTFSGQNTGANDAMRLRKGCRLAMTMMVGMCLLIGIGTLLCLRPLLSIFVQSPEAIEYGLQRGMITLLFYPILGLTHCLAAVFRGAGKPVISMIAFLGSWGILRVLFLMVCLSFWHEFAVLCWVYPVTWCVSTIYLLLYYWKGDWFAGRNAHLSASAVMEAA